NLYPAKGHNMWRDLERSCAELKLPFRRPDPFPQNSLLAARTALAALDQEWGENCCRALFRAEFADGRRIDDPAVVADVLAQLDIDPKPVVAAAKSDTIKMRRLGVFGAPSFTTADGELFWGNDRLEPALRWAKAADKQH